MYGFNLAGVTIMGAAAQSYSTHDGDASKTEAIHVIAVTGRKVCAPQYAESLPTCSLCSGPDAEWITYIGLEPSTTLWDI